MWQPRCLFLCSAFLLASRPPRLPFRKESTSTFVGSRPQDGRVKSLTVHVSEESEDSSGAPFPNPLLCVLQEIQTSQTPIGARIGDLWCPAASPGRLPAPCRLRKHQWLTFCVPKPPISSSLGENANLNSPTLRQPLYMRPKIPYGLKTRTPFTWSTK